MSRPSSSRPTAAQQAEKTWAQVFASACPETGENVEPISLIVNTRLTNALLRHVSEHLGPKRHVVLIMDGAGWHASNELLLPDNATPLLLLSHFPELYPIKRL